MGKQYSFDLMRPTVGLFVTCLVDLFRPSVGYAAIKLIEEAGCVVDVPPAQTCCGQSSIASGDDVNSREAAEIVIRTFEHFEYVVAPSSTCADMLKHTYPKLFENDEAWAQRAQAFSEKVYELTAFLQDVMEAEINAALLDRQSIVLESCNGLKTPSSHDLLSNIDGFHIVEIEDPNSCCGFGNGTCKKPARVANAETKSKLKNINAVETDMLMGRDLGCLMHMANKLKSNGSEVEVRHVAEVLAGDFNTPAIAVQKH